MWPSHLPAQHRHLMPKNGDLDLVGIRCRTAPERAQYPPDDHQSHRADHHDTSLPARHPRRSEPSPWRGTHTTRDEIRTELGRGDRSSSRS